MQRRTTTGGAYDAAVIGGGIAGFATAARLAARGLAVAVFEAHHAPGGCAGYFRRSGFSFDVGATTLVDFEPGGVGGAWLAEIGIDPIPGEIQPAYDAWLPDRVVRLWHDSARFAAERRVRLGDGPRQRAFWVELEHIASVFWRAARRGCRLPVQGPGDAWRALRAIGVGNLGLLRHVRHTVGDLLRAHGLRHDAPTTGLLAMLVEDTVHAQLDDAPLVNGALGATLRHAGLLRPRGGMGGFWRRLLAHVRARGVTLRMGCPVEHVVGEAGAFEIITADGEIVAARQVVFALPIDVTARIGPPELTARLAPWRKRDVGARGGAIIAFLGVPEHEVRDRDLTHHQILVDYDAPLGNGNNMFVSVSAEGDRESAPAGWRAVMLSTHCELDAWERLDDAGYRDAKRAAGERLVTIARRVYPRLCDAAAVFEVGTPRTYQTFTGRPRGAVGGVRQTLANSNQHAVPHDVGIRGVRLAGDDTWPGLGTVACILSSRFVAEDIAREALRLGARSGSINTRSRAELCHASHD